MLTKKKKEKKNNINNKHVKAKMKLYTFYV